MQNERRSDKGHVWLITLIFKLMYEQMLLIFMCMCVCALFFSAFALKQCVTRYDTEHNIGNRLFTLSISLFLFDRFP